MSPDVQRYQKGKEWFFIIGLMLDATLLLIFQFSGLSVQTRTFSVSLFSRLVFVHGMYLIIFCSGMYIFHFPLELFSGYFWEHRFGLSTQTLRAWFVDQFKKAVLTFSVLLIFVEVLYVLFARFPESWWIGAGIFWLVFYLFFARILPNVIIPFFYKYVDIEDQELRERILKLFKKCRVKVRDVYAINFSSKTKKANAFVCGLGDKRRVVLTDTLIAEFTHSEIEAVVAHELGHYKHRDINKVIVLNSGIVFVSFFLADRFLDRFLVAMGLSLPDIAALPLFVLVMTALALITTPVLNAFGRFIEVRADRFCLDLTKAPESFISMMEKLARLNLAEMRPGRLKEIIFYDHPPIAKRIAMAREFIST